jgi:hypothetical protein
MDPKEYQRRPISRCAAKVKVSPMGRGLIYPLLMGCVLVIITLVVALTSLGKDLIK